jgi:hypothetical protein
MERRAHYLQSSRKACRDVAAFYSGEIADVVAAQTVMTGPCEDTNRLSYKIL